VNYADMRSYLAGKFELMQAAQDRGDHDGIMRVVDSIEADGYPTVAAEIRADFAEQRLHGAWSGVTVTDQADTSPDCGDDRPTRDPVANAGADRDVEARLEALDRFFNTRIVEPDTCTDDDADGW
jgi:hypothetical protein